MLLNTRTQSLILAVTLGFLTLPAWAQDFKDIIGSLGHVKQTGRVRPQKNLAGEIVKRWMVRLRVIFVSNSAMPAAP